MEVKCLICGKPYEGQPVPKPPSHFWTCSDRCQEEFLLRGGMAGIRREDVLEQARRLLEGIDEKHASR